MTPYPASEFLRSTMASKLILSEIEGLAAGGAYAGTYTLSDETVALVLSWLALLFHWNWIGAGYSLTQAEIDTIDDMIAEALTELMEPVEANGMLIGAIIPYAGDTLPDDYLWCDGAEHHEVDYPDLYAALDSAFIVDGDHFVTPDMAANTPVGAGIGYGIVFDVGDTGGERIVTLTEAELPKHTHGVPQYDPGQPVGDDLYRLTYHSTRTTVQETDDGGFPEKAHENMPPYLIVNYIIYAGA